MPLNAVQQRKIKQRNKEIYLLHTIRGLTMREIGKMYGISRERVNQIISKIRKQEGVDKSFTGDNI